MKAIYYRLSTLENAIDRENDSERIFQIGSKRRQIFSYEESGGDDHR